MPEVHGNVAITRAWLTICQACWQSCSLLSSEEASMWGSKWDLARRNLLFFCVLLSDGAWKNRKRLASRKMPSFGYNPEQCGEAVGVRKGLAGSFEAQWYVQTKEDTHRGSVSIAWAEIPGAVACMTILLAWRSLAVLGGHVAFQPGPQCPERTLALM